MAREAARDALIPRLRAAASPALVTFLAAIARAQVPAPEPLPHDTPPIAWNAFTSPPLEGYPLAPSVAQGGTLGFCISGTVAACDIQFLRVGATDELLSRVEDLPVTLQQTRPKAYAEGCGWTTTHTLAVPNDWPSGLYLARLEAWPPGAAPEFEIPFVVRASPAGSESRVLSLSPDCTFQAYNAWGGACLYPSLYGPPSPVVSFLRPRDPASPMHPQWPRNFLRWLEAQALPVEYASEVDLHREPGLLDAYDLLLLSGHHEYWSREMRDAVDAFVGNGGRLLVLTGNTCFLQVRFEQGDTAIRCHKWAKDDPLFSTGNPADLARVTVPFACPPVSDPEDRTTGLGFRHAGDSGHLVPGCASGGFGGVLPCYPLAGGFGYWRVAAPAHPAFAGLGLKEGTRFGLGKVVSAGVSYPIPSVSGEVDGAPLEFLGGRLVASPTGGARRNLVVLADAPATWGTTAIVAFDDFGTVVNAGSGGFAQYPFNPPPQCGLPDLERVTRNLFDLLGRPRRSLVVNGGFERWDDGAPIGFVTTGAVERASDGVASGRSAAAVPGGPATIERAVAGLPGGERLTLSLHARTSGPGVVATLRDASDGLPLVTLAIPAGKGDFFAATGVAARAFDGIVEVAVPAGVSATIDQVEVWTAASLACDSLIPEGGPDGSTDASLALPVGASEGGGRFLAIGDAIAAGGAGSISLRNDATGEPAGKVTIPAGGPAPFAFVANDGAFGGVSPFSLVLAAPPGGTLSATHLAVVPLRAASPAPAGVPRNGGFEDPLGFEWSATGGATASRDESAPLVGAASLLVQAGPDAGGVEQTLPATLRPGRHLVSSWIRTASAGAELRLVRVADGATLWSGAATPSGAWEPVQGEVELAAAQIGGGVRLVLAAPPGASVRADAIRLRRVEAVLADDAYGNGAFEIAPSSDEEAAGSGWADRPPNWVADLPSPLLLDDAVAFEGARSLRIDPGSGATIVYSRVTTPMPTGAPWRLRAKCRVSPGASIVVALRAVRFGEAALALVDLAANGTEEEWETIEISSAAPPFRADRAADAWIFVTATGGPVWLDEVTVEADDGL